MAWVNCASAALIDHSNRNYGNVILQYDNSSTSSSMPCRLWWDYTQTSGSLNVTLRDLTVDGSNKGNVDVGTTDNQLWSGNITGGRNISISWYCNWYSGGYKGYSGSGYLPTGTVAPSGLDVTISDIKDTQVVFNVTLSSYGTPAAADGRYIEAALLDTSTYGDPYRWQAVANVSSATIYVDDATAHVSPGSLNIIGNRQYYYGAYANNTQSSTNVVKGTLITAPAYITDVTVNDVGGGEMVISVLHNREGTSDTVYTEYSYNQTNWTVVPETFRLTVHSAVTLYVRRRNSTGTTPVYTVSITPATTVKLYGSVNNQAKEIHKLYGSARGGSVRIRKLYGSVNGRSKLIYEDIS